MPVAWVITLGVCAASVFAVRDVVFPSLGPSAAPSLWQPKPSDTTAPSGGVTTVPDRLDVGTTISSVVAVSVVPADDTTATGEPAGSGTGNTTNTDRLGGGGSRPTPSTTTPSPGTTVPGGAQPGTTVPKSTSTTVAGGSTTVSPTTNPDTGDTLPDDTGGGGSGSGRGDHGNGTLP